MQWKSMATISAAMSARNENRTSRRHLPPLLPETCQQNCVMLVFLYYFFLFGKGIKTEKQWEHRDSERLRDKDGKGAERKQAITQRNAEIYRL